MIVYLINEYRIFIKNIINLNPCDKKNTAFIFNY